jgi:hypothetical protein
MTTAADILAEIKVESRHRSDRWRLAHALLTKPTSTILRFRRYPQRVINGPGSAEIRLPLFLPKRT